MTSNFTPLRRIGKPGLGRLREPSAAHTIGKDATEVLIQLDGVPPLPWRQAFGIVHPARSSGGPWEGIHPPQIQDHRIIVWSPLSNIDAVMAKIDERIAVANETYAQQFQDESVATAAYEEITTALADKWDAGGI